MAMARAAITRQSWPLRRWRIRDLENVWCRIAGSSPLVGGFTVDRLIVLTELYVLSDNLDVILCFVLNFF